MTHLSAPSTDPTYLPQIISKLRGMGYSFVSPYQAVTRGAIRSKYLALHGPAGFGAPTTGKQVATTAGTALQWFQRCRIYWSRASGAYEVHGAILHRYLGLRGTGSRLGLPVSDEFSVPGAGGATSSTARSSGTLRRTPPR
jgi:uncharacterized protein with LGFP repeats